MDYDDASGMLSPSDYIRPAYIGDLALHSITDFLRYPAKPDAVEIIFLTNPSPADLNSDGVVNGADLAILLAAWGPAP